MSDIIGNNGRPKRNFTIEQFRNDEDGTIQRRWKERIFSSEVVEVDIDEIFTELLLEEIDLYYDDPIKIGNLEFKASVIIKELLPDALNDTELLQPFNFDFYNVVADSGYCIFNGQTVVDSVTGICEQLEVAYKWVDLAPILREVQIDFLQENKDELLQAHKDELLQEVKEELDGFLEHEDPVEIEIYSRTTSVRRFLNSNGEESFRAVEKPEPQVVAAEGDSKMKDIKEMYRKRVFDELTPVQLDEVLLGEIDELNPPIKIGSLEFKAGEIIKKLRPDALENTEFLVALFESEQWYENMMNGLEYTYCWLYPPKDEKGEYLKYEGVNPEKDHSFFRYKDCQRIMRQVQIDFLQEYKNILLQENQNDLLQEVKKQFQYYEDELKHEDPVEIEIYSEDTSVRRFLNINGEESFRAVEKPEPQVVAANVHKAFTRSGFVVEEVIEGCKTEGCTAEKFVVNSWEHYGFRTFNDLTEGCKKGEHSEGDHTEGICPKCGKPVVYKDYFVVTSDAKALKTSD